MAGILDSSKLPTEPDPQYIAVDLSSGKDNLIASLNNASNLSDKDLYTAIKAGYKTMLNEGFINMNSNLLKKSFSNDKILACMIQVMQSVLLTPEETIYMNKIMYSMLKSTEAVDDYHKSLFMSLSKSVNKVTLPKLLTIMPDKVACTLAILRNASFKQATNVKRVNNYLIKCLNYNENTEQNIVDIYDALFEKVTPLLEGTMFDAVDRSTLTSEEYEVYAAENLALLDVLEGMPVQYIEQVLKSYSGDKNLLYSDMPVRFSLQSIAPSDYPRITSMVEALSASGSYIP